MNAPSRAPGKGLGDEATITGGFTRSDQRRRDPEHALGPVDRGKHRHPPRGWAESAQSRMSHGRGAPLVPSCDARRSWLRGLGCGRVFDRRHRDTDSSGSRPESETEDRDRLRSGTRGFHLRQFGCATSRGSPAREIAPLPAQRAGRAVSEPSGDGAGSPPSPTESTTPTRALSWAK